MKIEKAELMHSLDGTTVQISETSTWDLFLEDIGDILFGLLNNVLYDWMWEVRWGPVDEYGLSDQSLGHQLWRLSQWAGGGFGAWKREKKVYEFPVSDEWVIEHYPDAGWPWDGSEMDEMESKAGDDGDVIL